MWVAFRRCVAAALIASAVSVTGVAAQPFPDFYGTVVQADRPVGLVTLLVDDGQTVTVRVTDLGDAPWNEGAFQLDSVLVLRTQRVGTEYVAIGWEQARSGRERFRG